jgi:hypothetical protein
MKSLLVVVLMACDAGAPMPPPAAPMPAPAHERPELLGLTDTVEPPFTVAGGRTYAVVRLRGECDEATNLGGMHWRFEVDGKPAGFLLHGGGHGIYGDGKTLPGLVAADTIWNGRYYIAEVSLFRAPAAISGLDCRGEDKYSGTVTAVTAARSLEDARSQFSKIIADGFQPALRIDRMEDEPRVPLDVDAVRGR